MIIFVIISFLILGFIFDLTIEQKYKIRGLFVIAKNYISFRLRNLLLSYLGVGMAIDNIKIGTFKINYYMNDSIHTIIVKKNRLRRISHILHGDIDITSDLRPMMGPYGDFHGIPTTPKMLELLPRDGEGIVVGYKNLELVHYKMDDIIKTS